MQIAFARSVDPVVTSEHAVTRMAVTTEKEAEKQQGDNRTMGRKFTVPYALYRTHGTVNPFLAKQTGFTEDGEGSDLETLFGALEHAFDFDASAARPAGSMAPRTLLVFRHDRPLGNAPSHGLFDRLQVNTFSEDPAVDGAPPRRFADYASRITFDGAPLDDFIKPGEKKDLENGVTLIRRL